MLSLLRITIYSYVVSVHAYDIKKNYYNSIYFIKITVIELNLIPTTSHSARNKKEGIPSYMHLINWQKPMFVRNGFYIIYTIIYVIYCIYIGCIYMVYILYIIPYNRQGTEASPNIIFYIYH